MRVIILFKFIKKTRYKKSSGLVEDSKSHTPNKQE